MQHEKFGVYLNPREMKVVRINSPYWIPSSNEWVFITPDVNATLLNIREIVRQKKLVDQPDEIIWSGITEFKK